MHCRAPGCDECWHDWPPLGVAVSVENDGGPWMSVSEAMFSMPRRAMIACVGSGIVIAIALLAAVRATAGSAATRALLIPVIFAAVLVPGATRSSYKAWRAGYSPIPRIRTRKRFTTSSSVDDVLSRAREAALSMPRCKAESVEREAFALRFETGVSGPSWGERVSVSARPTDDGTTQVVVTSQPLWKPNILDSGTNQRNVRLVAERIAGPDGDRGA